MVRIEPATLTRMIFVATLRSGFCNSIEQMKHGSLFSGIGGFDLAAEWIGWENVFHCEINEFCNKILNHYWPDAKGYTDITKTDFSEWKGKVDIISGGFPCQPYSQAGKRKGKADDRHLWPEMLRAIREVQPMWIVGENVPGLLNWERGMVLAEIKADLESAGFEVFPPCILPACGKNAPHRRDRLWVVAHSFGSRTGRRDENSNGKGQDIETINIGEREFITNPNKIRFSNTQKIRKMEWWRPGLHHECNQFNISEIEPGVCRGNDGLSKRLDEDKLMALGNSIVPQVAYEIFKAIEKVNDAIITGR